MRLYPKHKAWTMQVEDGVSVYSFKPKSNWSLLYFKYVFFPIISPVLGYFDTRKNVTENNLKQIIDVDVDGIDHSDVHDFADSYISAAVWERSLLPLTETQLEQLNSNHNSFVYEKILERLF